jgi:hypothetical protein
MVVRGIRLSKPACQQSAQMQASGAMSDSDIMNQNSGNRTSAEAF